MSVRIINADVLDGLAQLPDESVHCVVTSPPYWGLRDYGVAGQIGLEPTPEAYVEKMVEVFREVRRVLRKDGTLWLNLGDSYVTSPPGRGPTPGCSGLAGINGEKYQATLAAGHGKHAGTLGAKLIGLKAKDLCGIPWRVAFALQADGWWLRQDLIWSKPNPMPESVTDRCTKAHEYLFLLAKSERYFFDAESISEAVSRPWNDSNGPVGRNRLAVEHGGQRNPGNGAGLETRNKRSVWEVTTQPFPEAHFATFPPSLIEPCIKAGCPEGGTVLDPFGGSGTAGLVADRLKRNAILIELNPEYASMAERRIKGDCPMFSDVEAA